MIIFIIFVLCLFPIKVFAGQYVIGNLGVGTVNPTATLEVNGTSKMAGFQLTASPTSGYSLVSDSNGVGSWQSVCSPWTRVAPNIYPSTITDNVGIGTAQPRHRFFVVGNLGIGSSDATQGITASGDGSFAHG